MKKVLLLAILTLGVNAFAFDMSTAMKSYQARDYKTAVTNWEFFAKRGDLSAQYNLAHMYLLGLGVETNQTLAAQWMWFAAEGGLAAAQYDFALMLLAGQGVEASDHRAMFWMKRAESQEYTKAIEFFEKANGSQLSGVYEEKPTTTASVPVVPQELPVLSQIKVEEPLPAAEEKASDAATPVQALPVVAPPVAPAVVAKPVVPAQKLSPPKSLPVAVAAPAQVPKVPMASPAGTARQYWARLGTLKSGEHTREVIDRMSKAFRPVMGKIGFRVEVNDDSGSIQTRILAGPFFSEKELVQYCAKVQNINPLQVCY